MVLSIQTKTKLFGNNSTRRVWRRNAAYKWERIEFHFQFNDSLWMQWRQRDTADQRVRKQQTEQRWSCNHCCLWGSEGTKREWASGKQPDLMGLLAVFWDPALISLLVCLRQSLMSPSLALWFPPPLKKKSVIIPVPKNNKPSCLNDCRPFALTSIVMKVFERFVKNHICSSIPVTVDPLQFAYRPNRSTDNAISQVLHSSLTYIDSKMRTM